MGRNETTFFPLCIPGVDKKPMRKEISMKKSLVVITGASSGIGEAIAQRLSAARYLPGSAIEWIIL